MNFTLFHFFENMNGYKVYANSVIEFSPMQFICDYAEKYEKDIIITSVIINK